tara:strand:+ start:155 stop:442 length:288 start_codon:yes stop_codon:yes gene_type:complete
MTWNLGWALICSPDFQTPLSRGWRPRAICLFGKALHRPLFAHRQHKKNPRPRSALALPNQRESGAETKPHMFLDGATTTDIEPISENMMPKLFWA